MNHLFEQFQVRSELNAFFTFFFDIIVTLFVFIGLLSFVGYPLQFTIENILPAIVIGILVGNSIYSWMSAKLSVAADGVKTALPLGIDITTLVPIILLIVGPSLQHFKTEFGDTDKALFYSWYVGMGASLWLGAIKFCLAFCSEMLRRIIPMAGMLGSIAGVAFAWLGADPILKIFELPPVGLLALMVVIVSLMARIRLPGGMPGAVSALMICLPLYYLLGYIGLMPENSQIQSLNWDMMGLHLPSFQTGGFSLLFNNTLGYISVIFPLGLLVAIIATNITAAAALSGNTYSTRKVIIADAFATFALGCFGGIGQTTPYLGHETYHKMGAKYLYGLFAVLTLLLVCFSGMLNVLLVFIPSAVFLPLLVIVCLDIIILSFNSAGKTNHSAAIIIAMIPAVMSLIYTKIDELVIALRFALASMESKLSESVDLAPIAGEVNFQLDKIMSNAWYDSYFALRLLSQGYILTAIIWGATISLIMDKKLHRAALFLSVASILSLFGIIHSVLDTGSMYLPWSLKEMAIDERIKTLPYEISGAYMLCAAFLVMVGLKSETAAKSTLKQNEALM